MIPLITLSLLCKSLLKDIGPIHSIFDVLSSLRIMVLKLEYASELHRQLVKNTYCCPFPRISDS